MTDRICVVDTSQPAFAAPLAHECIVTVEASAEEVRAGFDALLQVAAVLFVANLVLMWWAWPHIAALLDRLR